MKSIVLLLSICVLFTSCYSYKTYSGAPEKILVGKKYHFDFKNGKEGIYRIDSIGQDAYYYKRGNKVKSIAFSEIQKTEQGKFSITRTAGLTGGVAIAATGIAAIIVFLTNW